jgi:cytochrome b subunit of formate dehydrogenase
MSEKKIRTRRYGLFRRIVHWTIFLEGAYLLVSGFQLNGILPIGLTGALYSYHVIVGLAFIGTATIFVYSTFAGGDYRWFSLRRIPYSLHYIFWETESWFHVRPRLEDPIKFDPARNDYAEKIVPSFAVVWWAYALLGLLMTFTGLADAFPSTFSFVYTVLNPIGLALTGVGGLPLILAVHRLSAVLILCVVAMHVYSNYCYKVVSSMVFGYRNETVVARGSSEGGAPAMGKTPAVQRSVAVAAPDESEPVE